MFPAGGEAPRVSASLAPRGRGHNWPPAARAGHARAIGIPLFEEIQIDRAVPPETANFSLGFLFTD